MRVRYAIERGVEPGTVYVVLVDTSGEPVGGGGFTCRDEAEARAVIASDHPALKWKPAPADWQPDTYLVTAYFEDEGWDR